MAWNDPVSHKESAARPAAGPITSRDNPLIKEYARLAADAAFRRESGLFALEGARLCADAAASGAAVRTVLYTARAAEQYGAYLGPLLSVCPDCREIAAPLAGRLSDTQTPQGIFCICRRLDNRLPLGKIKRNGRYLLLEDVQDPGNLGTIVRTAEAFGIDGLFLTAGCCDLYNPKVLRGSMGGVLRLASARTEDPSSLLACLREKGLSAFACVADAGARPVHQTRLGEGCVCLIGNEGAGLRPETAALCDERITIPMKGRAESLNASIAAAIVLWEMTR